MLPMLAGCIEGLFFHPDNRAWSTPREFGVEAQDVFIEGPDGTRLHAWWLPSSGTPRGSMLYLHGNAANVSNHLPLVAWLPPRGWNVLLLDYRGFGKSSGKPSLDGVVADARAALAWLRARRAIDAPRLVVAGSSLGGATALRAVAADAAGVGGVVVDSAFASYRGIARDAAGVLGFVAAPLIATLPGDASDPLAAIRQLRVPVFVLHGSSDGVIPIAHGQALYAAANEPKRWLGIAGGRHLDALMRPDVRAALVDWLGGL
jgi:fermentation-respiration switch protein FrsA (DUF1100 family)